MAPADYTHFSLRSKVTVFFCYYAYSIPRPFFFISLKKYTLFYSFSIEKFFSNFKQMAQGLFLLTGG